MSSSVWQLDRARNLYYHVDAVNHLYIYQNGLTISYAPDTQVPNENEEHGAHDGDEVEEEEVTEIDNRGVSHDRDPSDGSNFSILSGISGLSITATNQSYGSSAAGALPTDGQSTSNEGQASSYPSPGKTPTSLAYQAGNQSYESSLPGPGASTLPYSTYSGQVSYSTNAATRNTHYSMSPYHQQGYSKQGLYTTNRPIQQFGAAPAMAGHNYMYTPNAGRPDMTYSHSQGSGQPTGFTKYDQSNAYSTNQQAYMPAQYAQPASQGQAWKPSDEEVLEEVKRNVDLKPLPQPGFVPRHPLQAFRNAPHRAFRATSNPSEKLDRDYFVHPPSFFKKGVVFRVLWPELAGDLQENITIATTSRFEDEKFFVKVRWFVVVRELHYSCACLSIQTYKGKGVSAKGKLKHHHSIMHTNTTAPQPLAAELPQFAGEAAMGKSIRVIGRLPYDSKMDPMSRVNFLKIYTVEHNVKVKDFGYVAPEDHWSLMTQFASHWHISGPDDGLPAATYPTRSGGTGSQVSTQTLRASPTTPTPASERPGLQSSASASYMASYMPKIPESTATGHQEAQDPPINHSGTQGQSYLGDEYSDEQPGEPVFSEYAPEPDVGDETTAPISGPHSSRRRRRSSKSDSTGQRPSRSESTGHRSSRSGRKH